MTVLGIVSFADQGNKFLILTNSDYYTVGHKKRASYIFRITFADMDRF